MSARLEITSADARGSRVIAITGDADISSLADVQAHLDKAFGDGRDLLVIDLSAAGFVDSSLLHTLMRALRRARLSGGDIAVVCVDPRIRRILDLFGLTTTVRIYRSVAEASAALDVGAR